MLLRAVPQLPFGSMAATARPPAVGGRPLNYALGAIPELDMHFGGFLALGAVGGVLYLALANRGSRAAAAYRQEASWWTDRMEALQPIVDVEDDGHLFECLDVSDWEKVFSLLEKAPPGSRSLKSAIKSVAPDTL